MVGNKNEFEKLLKEREKRSISIHKGMILDCKVADIWEDKVVVDLGRKVEGIVPLSEFDEVSVGDEFKAMVKAFEEGFVILSRRSAMRALRMEDITKAHRERKPIYGDVIKRIKGGYEVDLGDGIIAFMPSSHSKDMVEGKRGAFCVIEADGGFVVSRKVFLEEERKRERREVISRLKVGEVFEATIKRVHDLYATADLGGGIEAKFLKEDVSWENISSISEVLAKGDKVKVKVLDVKGSEENGFEIKVGMKQLRPDPWEEAKRKYVEGKDVEGLIVSIKNFGAFVRVEKGIEAFLPASEMSWTRFENVEDVVKKGEKITARIIKFNSDEKRMVLSLKRMTRNPYTVLKRGTKVKGVVKKITRAGADVDINFLGQYLHGFLPTGEMTWEPGKINPEEHVKEGGEYEFLVIDVVPKDRKAYLSLRRLKPHPFLEMLKEYGKGKIVTATVVRKTRAGTLVRIDGKIDGFIPLRELLGKPSEYPEDSTIECKVTGADPDRKIVVLSEKEAIMKITEKPERKVKDILKNVLK